MLYDRGIPIFLKRSKQESQFLSLSTPINKQIEHFNKSPSSHDASFLSTKISLKAAASSSSTTSSLANNLNGQVKFLIDFSGSKTRLPWTDDNQNRRALLFNSPRVTTSSYISGSNRNFNETPAGSRFLTSKFIAIPNLQGESMNDLFSSVSNFKRVNKNHRFIFFNFFGVYICKKEKLFYQ